MEALRDSMSRLVGTWRTQGRMVGDGRTWEGFDIYEWFPGRNHLVHRVDVRIFGGRRESIELLTPRDGSLDTFDQISFDAEGTVEVGVGSFDGEGRYRIDGPEARAVLTFRGPDAMSARWELRGPTGSWSDWMDVTFTRVGEPHIEVRSREGHP